MIKPTPLMKLPEHLRLRAFTLIAGVICGMALCSCSENDGEENEYANWKPRNESYFSKIMQTTGDSIAYAKRVYGEKWEEFSNRRQFLCFSRQFDAAHKQTDSIAVEILKRGADDGVLPYSNDSGRGFFAVQKHMFLGAFCESHGTSGKEKRFPICPGGFGNLLCLMQIAFTAKRRDLCPCGKFQQAPFRKQPWNISESCRLP